MELRSGWFALNFVQLYSDFQRNFRHTLVRSVCRSLQRRYPGGFEVMFPGPGGSDAELETALCPPPQSLPSSGGLCWVLHACTSQWALHHCTSVVAVPVDVASQCKSTGTVSLYISCCCISGCCIPVQVNGCCIPVQVNGCCICVQVNGQYIHGDCILEQINGCCIPV